MTRRVLVTGAAGFLGSHLVDRLLAEGHEVVGVDMLTTGRRNNLRDALRSRSFRFVEADVSNGRLPQGFDDIYHLASPASPPDYMRRPFETLRCGAHATMSLLELARRDDARLLLASTSEVYGDPEVTPQQESYWGAVNPVGPRSVYDEAKRFAEAATMAAHRTWGLDTRIARIFNTYGPRMRPDDGRVVSNFIVQGLLGRPLTVHGDGTQTRSFCYVDDLIEGFLALMARGDNEPTNLGNPEELSVLRLADTVRAHLHVEVPLRFLPLPQDDPKQRRPDITRATTRLGWRPRVPLESGLRRTIAHFREQVVRPPVPEVVR